jgi:hypothetical protein
MKRFVAVLAVALLCAAPAPSSQLRFVGRWEVVHDRADGLFGGASARSYHPGDVADLLVTGTAFRIFGITGPSGGHAIVFVGGAAVGTMDFYSPVKRTHVLLYTSPYLSPGTHRATILVASSRDAASRGTYVNIDLVDVTS